MILPMEKDINSFHMTTLQIYVIDNKHSFYSRFTLARVLH